MNNDKLSTADVKALERMPDEGWFDINDLPYSIRCPRYRCDRLVERGVLETQVTGEYPHLKSEYRKTQPKGSK